MGHASERHDINSYETQAGVWIAFRQPVLREKARRDGKNIKFTYEVNPGEVWEEDEFWIELSWRIDKDGDLGIRKHFLSPFFVDILEKNILRSELPISISVTSLAWMLWVL